MTAAACKVIVCSWNELFTLPPGHALETALRHTYAIGEIARGVEDSGLVDGVTKVLGEKQLNKHQQEYLVDVLKKISGIDD